MQIDPIKTNASQQAMGQPVQAANPQQQEESAQKNIETLLKLPKEEQAKLIEEAIDNMNQMLDSFQKGLRFHFFVEGTDLAYVEVVDQNTGEVIREVPPEEVVKAMVRMHRSIGFLLDKYM